MIFLRQVVQRVHQGAVAGHGEVAVGAAADAGGAHAGDLLALVHMLAHRHQQGAVVAIGGDEAVAVVDLHIVAVAAPAVLRTHYGAGFHSVDVAAVGGADVHAHVVGAGAGGGLVTPAVAGGNEPAVRGPDVPVGGGRLVGAAATATAAALLSHHHVKEKDDDYDWQEAKQ